MMSSKTEAEAGNYHSGCGCGRGAVLWCAVVCCADLTYQSGRVAGEDLGRDAEQPAGCWESLCSWRQLGELEAAAEEVVGNGRGGGGGGDVVRKGCVWVKRVVL
jgi:hypothetical protein